MAKPRVAIIGAGAAGLSCAHELERLGCQPVIYEISRSVGHPFPHTGAILEILFRSITTQDLLAFARQTYDISLMPLNRVKKIIHISANSRSIVQGDLGYLVIRGQLENSIDNQISDSLKNTHILFDHAPDWQKLTKVYDYVVVATARKDIPASLGLWQDTVSTSIMGAIVLGSFDENTLSIWLNNDYTNKGYAYLAPYNSKRASLVLCVANIDTEQLPAYWKKFFTIEKFNFTVVEEFQTTLTAGLVYPHKVKNLYFAGVSGGFIDPLLGMGAFPSIASGVIAARSTIYHLDYEKEISFLINLIKKVNNIRNAFIKLNNTDINRLIAILGLPGVQQLIYRTKINVIDHIHSLINLW
ncbi:NAD(P)-binding protein [Pelotomaculum sp. PtaB.Bin117]|uniref:NAD(P)-binding protein n=1 Tax=Pelotomaculum sp. PtaB.Bin117 TaxID=1811694 RepID=UPI0009C641E1|nr:NAD(P)-binding protein [Pelotomaculum sp. PtaB.Bin117]OPX87669.1 MAG: glutamate synthase subunit beta [Pelotomaculum sp. PtaB.Bin117]OPY61233.1 MAG: glutamate synthase subunit beta [Pelotomaculum sp. PtaU1.Bin065]